MTPTEQVALWVEGKSVHNVERDECCPDFSCCGGKLAPLDVRKRFQQAHLEGDEATIMEFLMLFLGEMIANNVKTEVYVAGLISPEDKIQ